MLEGCGHVPQVERPEQTNGLLERFFARVDALGARARAAGGVTPRRSTNGHGSPETARAQRCAPGRHEASPERAPAALLGSRARRGQGPRGEPDPARRPRRARPGLHPREPAAAVAAVLAVLPRRGARARQRARGGRRAAGRQPLRRQPDAGHDRLHARLLDLLRGRARLPPARPQPRALASRACPTCASTARSRPRRRTPARRWRPARRCSSTRAATTRSTGPSWQRHRVDFGGRKGFIRLALEQDVPIVPVVAVGGQETALFLSRGESLAKVLGLDRLFRLKVLPISLALPWGLNVGDMLGHIPLPAKITVEALPPIHLREEFGARARRRRGLRPRRAADAGHPRRARRRAAAAGDRMRVAESIEITAPPALVWEPSPTPRATCTSCPASRAGRSRASRRPGSAPATGCCCGSARPRSAG